MRYATLVWLPLELTKIVWFNGLTSAGGANTAVAEFVLEERH